MITIKEYIETTRLIISEPTFNIEPEIMREMFEDVVEAFKFKSEINFVICETMNLKSEIVKLDGEYYYIFDIALYKMLYDMVNIVIREDWEMFKSMLYNIKFYSCYSSSDIHGQLLYNELYQSNPFNLYNKNKLDDKDKELLHFMKITTVLFMHNHELSHFVLEIEDKKEESDWTIIAKGIMKYIVEVFTYERKLYRSFYARRLQDDEIFLNELSADFLAIYLMLTNFDCDYELTLTSIILAINNIGLINSVKDGLFESARNDIRQSAIRLFFKEFDKIADIKINNKEEAWSNMTTFTKPYYDNAGIWIKEILRLNKLERKRSYRKEKKLINNWMDQHYKYS